MTYVICHMTYDISPMSYDICHMSYVICNMSKDSVLESIPANSFSSFTSSLFLFCNLSLIILLSSFLSCSFNACLISYLVKQFPRMFVVCCSG